MVISVSRRTKTLMSNRFYPANPVCAALGPVRWEEDSGDANVPSKPLSQLQDRVGSSGHSEQPEGSGLRRFNRVGLLRTL